LKSSAVCVCVTKQPVQVKIASLQKRELKSCRALYCMVPSRSSRTYGCLCAFADPPF
jgi:hypothetical protein